MGRASVNQRNVDLLRQGIALLKRIDDERFTAFPPIELSTVGGHFRHCIEFYRCLLAGLDGGAVDYDARDRDLEVERKREVAILALEGIETGLSALEGEDPARPLTVAAGADGSDGETLRSTLGRELQFACSHTIHHFALIAGLLRLQGFEPGADFGVAASTLEYRRKVARGV